VLAIGLADPLIATQVTTAENLIQTEMSISLSFGKQTSQIAEQEAGHPTAS
jgi:hypothetical protein